MGQGVRRPLKYWIVHRTHYRYNAPVSRCRNEAHLRPRDTDRQQCLSSDLVVDPTPTSWSERSDFFDNPVVSFAVNGPFDELTVTSTSSVSVSSRELFPIIGSSLGAGRGAVGPSPNA